MYKNSMVKESFVSVLLSWIHCVL